MINNERGGSSSSEVTKCVEGESALSECVSAIFEQSNAINHEEEVCKDDDNTSDEDTGFDWKWNDENANFGIDSRRSTIRNENFLRRKRTFLGKRDKSSAGQIDAKVVNICDSINHKDSYYTTSSCSGRSFLYRGSGTKKQSLNDQRPFERFRVSHDLIRDAVRYFDLETLESDPSGGGDHISYPRDNILQDYNFETKNTSLKTIETDSDDEPSNANVGGVEDNANNNLTRRQVNEEANPYGSVGVTDPTGDESIGDESIWLRYEPFILHVACRSWTAAKALMAAARPSFKNVGLTAWDYNKRHLESSRFIVAIWGDEGLDMPLSMPDGTRLFPTNKQPDPVEWLASLVNHKHERNWEKMDRFAKAVQNLIPPDDSDEEDANNGFHPVEDDGETTTSVGGTNGMSPATMTDGRSSRQRRVTLPRSFDVIGDVALLHSIPSTSTGKEEDYCSIGEAMLQRNRAIQIVALRRSNLLGPERAPGDDGLVILASRSPRSLPLITTHCEYGIKCVVDVNHTFFSPRMAQERLRICQKVQTGENVLVLFCGVGMDAMQIAGRTAASQITAIDQNEIAIQCALRSRRMLERNKSVPDSLAAAQRLNILLGDVREIVGTFPRRSYDRILAPRPKGKDDGDLGQGSFGREYLEVVLPIIRLGGEFHWYDFVSDAEFPQCQRTRHFLQQVCQEQDLVAEILQILPVGSVAKRQLRVCVDFRVAPLQNSLQHHL